MTDHDTNRDTTAVRYGATPIIPSINSALLARSDALRMTQDAEEAVLKPLECGSWSHSLRAALAARIASLNSLPEVASHYTEMIKDDKHNCVANPSDDCTTIGLAHVIAFMDGVTVEPRKIDSSDIKQLQDATVSDADIVRLTELIAFMAYQVRLIVGLKLLSRGAA